MAGGMDLGTGGRGGRKSLDATINLVPFIDLMAVTISFLIMTAVWTQIGRLEVAQAGGESVTPDAPRAVALNLLLGSRQLRLTVGGATTEPIVLVRDERSQLNLSRLRTRLEQLKRELPNQTSITVQAEDAVPYQDLVGVIDQCIGAGLSNVSVAAAM